MGCCSSADLKLYSMPNVEQRAGEVVGKLEAVGPKDAQGKEGSVVKVVGRAVGPKELLVAPLTERACVCYVVSLEVKPESATHGDGVGDQLALRANPWRRVKMKMECVDFGLGDENSEVAVVVSKNTPFPFGMLENASRAFPVGQNSMFKLPDAVAKFADEHDISRPGGTGTTGAAAGMGAFVAGGDQARLIEHVILPGDLVACVGKLTEQGTLLAASDDPLPSDVEAHLPKFWTAVLKEIGPRLLISNRTTLVGPHADNVSPETTNRHFKPAAVGPVARYAFDNFSKTT